MIKIGIYICPTRDFAKLVSPKDGSSMVNYERTKWYLENFYAVLTVPILFIGLKG
ncbi:BglII/BstYI family type II restriction endonuclease [Chloroflexota bacterium]